MRFKTNIYLATLYQFGVALLLLWLTRFAFGCYNYDSIGRPSFGHMLMLSAVGLRFDLSAAVYFNALFIVMRTLPLPWAYNRLWLKASAWVFGITNAVMLAINIGDIPYYRFTGARLRWTNILNITTDSDIASIVAKYAGQYAVFFIAAALTVVLMVWLYRRVEPTRPERTVSWGVRSLIFIAFAAGAFLAMRGRVGSGIPLAIPDAAFYVDSSREINFVLNSPFCVLRSLNPDKANTERRLTFFTDDEMQAVRDSRHRFASDSLRRRNIMTIIIESGGSTWIDTLNVSPPGGHFGLMPFLDSIASESTVFLHTIACSRSSCGGATAVLAGFPAFDPFYFMLSPYNKNTVDSPARLLAARGWQTAFFYGVKHGSFNIDQTAYAMGYKYLANRDTYANDDDYDGMWGIFDEPMARFVVGELNSMAQPFAAAWFTVSAHGPFTVPDGFDTSVFVHPEASAERGLEYTDVALRTFFTEASKQPWYDNTTFIITADHGNRDFKGTPFDGDYVRNHIPFIVYTPDGSVKPQIVTDRVMSQHDIAPTTLALVGYDEPFIALGDNAFDADSAHIGITRTDGGRYFIVGTRYGVYTSDDAAAIEDVYDIVADPELTSPLARYDSTLVDSMVIRARAFLQDYTHSLLDDKMSLQENLD